MEIDRGALAERREDEAASQHGDEIVDETRRHPRLAVVRAVEAEFEHDGIDRGTDVVDIATPASQLGRDSQPSSQCVPAAQPRNGNTKPASPTALASRHFRRKTCGSSSVPARKVRMMAPAPDKNLISQSAVATLSQIDSRTATKAKPRPIAVCAHTCVMASSHRVKTFGRSHQPCGGCRGTPSPCDEKNRIGVEPDGQTAERKWQLSLGIMVSLESHLSNTVITGKLAPREACIP